MSNVMARAEKAIEDFDAGLIAHLDLDEAIKMIIRRAEAAEARAADAEIRAKSWHDSAMTLADQRDAAYRRNTELEAERDELARKLEQAQRELNHYHRLHADIDMGVITLEYPRSDEG